VDDWRFFSLCMVTPEKPTAPLAQRRAGLFRIMRNPWPFDRHEPVWLMNGAKKAL
jgi:hypothetical protein